MIKKRRKRLLAKEKKQRKHKCFKNKENSEYNPLLETLRLKEREYHYKYLCMSKERFDHLYQLVEPKIRKQDTRLRKCVCARERLVITLRYLSTGCSQQTLWHSFEWKKISDDFSELLNMPHVAGAIDGKHIAMDCLKGSGTQNYNYKGFYSVVLLAVCDAKYNFTMVDVGAYGSNNDSGVLIHSEMGQRFEEDSHDIPKPEPLHGGELDKLPFDLVGDEVLPLKTWMMRPYSGSLNEEQSIFNYRLSRARRVIENAFGILVARWGLFRGPIRASRDNVVRYTMAAISLHNYLRQTESATWSAGFVDSEDSSGKIKLGEGRNIAADDTNGLLRPREIRGSLYSLKATEMRDVLRSFTNSDVGAVPLQWDYIRRKGEE